jgi:hypothetical protein
MSPELAQVMRVASSKRSGPAGGRARRSTAAAIDEQAVIERLQHIGNSGLAGAMPCGRSQAELGLPRNDRLPASTRKMTPTLLDWRRCTRRR